MFGHLHCVPLISKPGRMDRLFNFCLDPININSVFVMLRVNLLAISQWFIFISPDLKKPQGSRCCCRHMLGEYHRHTFLVANLINNWVSH